MRWMTWRVISAKRERERVASACVLVGRHQAFARAPEYPPRPYHHFGPLLRPLLSPLRRRRARRVHQRIRPLILRLRLRQRHEYLLLIVAAQVEIKRKV
jgi:hypothetical protein